MKDTGFIKSKGPVLAALMLCTVAAVIALLYFKDVLERIRISPSRSARAPAEIPADAISGQRAFGKVKELYDIGPRPSGSSNAENAAVFLMQQVQSLGLKASLDMFSELTPAGDITFRNIIGTLPGSSNAVIVLVSHYDTKAGISKKFAGANDSASSTGLLLEIARVAASVSNRHPELVFAFVDGEECRTEYSERDGLHGSRQLAGWLIKRYGKSAIRGAIVLDMIGDRDLNVTIPRNSANRLIDLAFRAAEKEGQRHRFSLHAPVLDDHITLIGRGIPAVDLIDFNYGSAPGSNDFWHTDQDTMDKISPDSLQIIGRITVHMINSLSAGR